MKIVAANVVKTTGTHVEKDEAYRAHVTIMSDGERTENNATGYTPDQALQAAFSAAIKSLADKVRSTLSVGMTVNF